MATQWLLLPAHLCCFFAVGYRRTDGRLGLMGFNSSTRAGIRTCPAFEDGDGVILFLPFTSSSSSCFPLSPKKSRSDHYYHYHHYIFLFLLSQISLAQNATPCAFFPYTFSFCPKTQKPKESQKASAKNGKKDLVFSSLTLIRYARTIVSLTP